jgi:hypothetical protein
MKDELITFETAKLAKEKGFDWSVVRYWFPPDINDKCYWEWNSPKDYNKLKEAVSIPTQSLLQKWLREVHKIHITIHPYAVGDLYFAEWVKTEGMEYEESGFISYELALEFALQESLKLIK